MSPEHEASSKRQIQADQLSDVDLVDVSVKAAQLDVERRNREPSHEKHPHEEPPHGQHPPEEHSHEVQSSSKEPDEHANHFIDLTYECRCCLQKVGRLGTLMVHELEIGESVVVSDLLRGLLTVNRGSYKCKWCEQPFCGPDALEAHTKTHVIFPAILEGVIFHNDSFHCQMCGCEHTDFREFEKHYRTHKKFAPFSTSSFFS